MRRRKQSAGLRYAPIGPNSNSYAVSPAIRRGLYRQAPVRASSGAVPRAFGTMPQGAPVGTYTPPIPGNQGLQDGQAISDSGTVNSTFINQYPQMVKIAGATWLRVGLRLGSSFSSWTPAVLALYDTIVNKAIESGLNVLGLINNESYPGSQTDWVANNHEQLAGTGDNTYIGNLASSANTIAAHFGTRIQAYEIWNEPDAWTSNPSDAIYTGGSFIYPSNFAWMLKHCFDNIRSANPYAKIISGGLFTNDLGPSIGSFDTTYYIPNFISYGINSVPWSGTPFDFAGEHIYIDQGTTTTSAHMQTACDVIHNAFTTALGTAMSMWITEVGWTIASVSEQVQSSNLQTAYQTFKSNSYITRAFWFNNSDVPGSGQQYGLSNSSGTPRLSLSAYRQYAQF